MKNKEEKKLLQSLAQMSPTDQQIHEKEVAKSKELAAEEQILLLKTRNTQLCEEIESLKNMCKHYESVVSFFHLFFQYFHFI